MLVCRTIDKPKEKLELFKKFLNEHKLNPVIDDSKKDILLISNCYITERKIAEIITVSKNTIKIWRINNKITPTPIYNHGYYNCYFYDIKSILDFLMLQVHYSNDLPALKKHINLIKKHTTGAYKKGKGVKQTTVL